MVPKYRVVLLDKLPFLKKTFITQETEVEVTINMKIARATGATDSIGMPQSEEIGTEIERLDAAQSTMDAARLTGTNGFRRGTVTIGPPSLAESLPLLLLPLLLTHPQSQLASYPEETSYTAAARMIAAAAWRFGLIDLTFTEATALDTSATITMMVKIILVWAPENFLVGG